MANTNPTPASSDDQAGLLRQFGVLYMQAGIVAIGMGIGGMGLGYAWFVIGLSAGTVFYVGPPILFFGGLLFFLFGSFTLIRGLFTYSRGAGFIGLLAVANFFGALLFIWVGVMDYAKREAWAYANFTHDVLVDGLPLDDKEMDPYESPLRYKLGDSTKKEWFPSNPVSTQVEEVNRVKKAVDAQVAGAGDDAVKQTMEYARILKPFATNNGEREYLVGIQFYLGSPEDQARLRKRLDDAFIIAVANYAPRTSDLKFETAFADACREVGGVPAPAVEQAFVKYLPAKPEKTFADAAKEALAVAPPDPVKNPISPEQYHYDMARAFLAFLRDDKNAVLRKPGDDPAKVKGALDDVFQATLPPIHDNLKGQYDALFDAALVGPKSLDPSKTDRVRDYQREAIARLLFNMVEVLDPNAPAQGVTGSPDYTRFVTVVGLNMAAHEINEQAQVLQTIGEQLQGARDRERADFAAAYRARIDELQARAVLLHDANDLLARKTQQLADEDQAVRKQQDKVKNAEAELADARSKTDAEMTKLRKTSDSLHKMRIEGRDLLGENLELEKQIRDLEKKH